MLGVHDELRHEVVFVEVTNPAARPMKLTKLEYTFAASGSPVATGEVSLSRDVPGNASVVLEVPLDATTTSPSGPVQLDGALTAEVDDITRRFHISAEIQPAH